MTTLVGSQEPRIMVVPDGDEHPRWNEVLELLDRVGIKLDPWQLLVLWTSMLMRGDVWAAFTVATCAPRQNGKNVILEARELVGALVLIEQLIIHSAHLADTCMEAFVRLDDRIDANDWLGGQVKAIRRTNGREAVHFKNGCRIRFRTRTRGGGRGFSGSPVIFDEPMFFPSISHNAILPVMSAQPNPQAWYTGSAVDQRDHDDGVVFARVRERALEGSDPRLAYFEWSLDAASPDEVTPEMARDRIVWAATNPAFGIRITEEYIEAEQHELLPRGFAVERLGVGDWPDTSDVSDSPISPDAWNGLGDEDARIVGPVCVAFDVSPERNAAIVEVGVGRDGRLVINVVRVDDGTAWVPEALAEMCEDQEVVEVLCDGYGPAASVVSDVEDAGVTVRTIDSSEHTQACGRLFDHVRNGEVVHLGDRVLSDAIRGASTRALVDAWAWSRKNSSVDISPLVASTLAVWSAVEHDLASAGELAIY